LRALPRISMSLGMAGRPICLSLATACDISRLVVFGVDRSVSIDF
jgi:hypothetical protein